MQDKTKWRERESERERERERERKGERGKESCPNEALILFEDTQKVLETSNMPNIAANSIHQGKDEWLRNGESS